MSVKIVTHESKIDGKGIFAGEAICAGQTLFSVQGPTLHYTSKNSWRLGPDWLNVGPNTWQVAYPKSPWININHSCCPNCILGAGNKVNAVRAIAPGEELTIDYSFTEAQREWRMYCRCGEQECRRVIRSIQFLPVEHFEKYEKDILPYLREEYRKQKVEFKKQDGTKVVVAKLPLERGAIAYEVEGPTITYTKAPHYRVGFRWLGIGENTWLIPEDRNPWKYMRHSCEPNVGLMGKTTVVALRSIAVGDELVVDDSITEADPRWKVKCVCGTPTCRKVVRSIQFLPEDLYKKYLPYIPQFFQRVYSNRNK